VELVLNEHNGSKKEKLFLVLTIILKMRASQATPHLCSAREKTFAMRVNIQANLLTEITLNRH
jgi:hypothetical protein